MQDKYNCNCAAHIRAAWNAHQVRRLIAQYKKTLREQNYVAHALGGMNGYSYTNSLEALYASYQEGYRIFEVDVSVTSDGKLVCAHGWSEKDYRERFGLEYHKESAVMSKDDFMQIKIQKKYTPLSVKVLLDFIKGHQDSYFLIDLARKTGKETEKIFRKICQECRGSAKVLHHIIASGQTTEMLEAIANVYDFPLKNLYYAKNEKREACVYSKEDFLRYCKAHHIMSLSLAANNYDPNIVDYLRQSLYIYVFTVNEQEKADRFIERGDLVGTDFLGGF